MTPASQRLRDLAIALPAAAKPVANYVPWVRTGNLLFISGQLPLQDGAVLHKGLLGQDVALDAGKDAARQAAINILAQVQAACGTVDSVRRVVKITGFVACAPTFTDHPQVVNGASDLLAEVFGEAGRHARAAVGVASLPLNACVEVEAVIEVA